MPPIVVDVCEMICFLPTFVTTPCSGTVDCYGAEFLVSAVTLLCQIVFGNYHGPITPSSKLGDTSDALMLWRSARTIPSARDA